VLIALAELCFYSLTYCDTQSILLQNLNARAYPELTAILASLGAESLDRLVYAGITDQPLGELHLAIDRSLFGGDKAALMEIGEFYVGSPDITGPLT
jgi:hypothetical protein